MLFTNVEISMPKIIIVKIYKGQILGKQQSNETRSDTRPVILKSSSTWTSFGRTDRSWSLEAIDRFYLFRSSRFPGAKARRYESEVPSRRVCRWLLMDDIVSAKLLCLSRVWPVFGLVWVSNFDDGETTRRLWTARFVYENLALVRSMSVLSEILFLN